MAPQSDSTRSKITAILEQVGMSDEELYQLLYGRQQQVEVDISTPRLLDASLFQTTEHTAEELEAIAARMDVLEALPDIPPETLEEVLEGELVVDDVEGLLLKKRYRNGRKGLMQFLAFLSFANLLKLALAMAAIAAPNLIARFENLKNRPQDRNVLADFILAQLEQPTPPILAALTAGGALFSPEIGEVEFAQPLTAAIIVLDDSRVKQLRQIPLSPEELEQELSEDIDRDDTHGVDYQKAQLTKRMRQTAMHMNKLEVLERTEALIAHKQMLHELPDQDNSRRPRSGKPRGTGRRAREQQQREAQEREQAAATAKPTREISSAEKLRTPQQSMAHLMEGLQLNVLKGLKVEHVAQPDISQAKKSNITKDDPVLKNKPTPQHER